MKTKTLSIKLGKQLNINQFPNFSASGSIKGMKKMYYGDNALLVKCGSYIYYVGNLNNRMTDTMSLGESIYFCYAK